MPPSRWASFAAEAAVPEQLVPYVRAVSDLEPLECGASSRGAAARRWCLSGMTPG
ncbi:MAG: hypothetical protein ACLSAH_13770 [Bilophila wadsworthia]